MKNTIIKFLLCSLTMSTSLSAMQGINLQDHALPSNSIRAKLDSIFQGTKDPKKLETDPSWHNFNSYHWLVGLLTTAGGNTKFVVKTASHPAGVAITSPGMMPITHDIQQNISRIAQAEKAKKVVAQENLEHFRVQGIWAYPMTGNNADLNNPNITDQDVVVVEEYVEDTSAKQHCPIQMVEVQTSILNLSNDELTEVETLAKKGKILDLHTRNLVKDKDGKMVNIDWEDLLLLPRKQVEQSNFIIKPLRKYELKGSEEMSAILGVFVLAAANKAHHPGNAKLEEKYNQLQVDLGLSTLKANGPRAVIQLTLVGTAIGLFIRNRVYTSNVKKLVKDCREEIKEQLMFSNQINESEINKLARLAVTKLMPTESRQEVFNAFATITLAEDMYYKGATSKVTILGKEYDSTQKAVDSSVEFIDSTWRSDRSIRSKIARGVMSAGKGLINLFKKSEPVAAIAA